jgi:hypothetical protein
LNQVPPGFKFVLLLLHLTCSINIVTYRSVARQRLGKHIPAEAYGRSNRTSIIRQRISKKAFSTT